MKRFSRYLALFGVGVALLTASSIPAMANAITTATATLSCGPPNSYTATFTGVDLNPSIQYAIAFQITATPPSPGSPVVISSFVLIPAKTSGNFSVSASGTETLNPGVTYTLTGVAVLRNVTNGVNANEIPISFTNSNNQITCAQQSCNQPSSNPSNFNGTQINSGTDIWFNANFSAKGIPSTGATINFTNSTILLNGTTFAVPNGTIIFTSSVSCASTTLSGGTWTTTVPLSDINDDEIFLSGLLLPVSASTTGGGLPGGLNPVTWNGTFSTSSPNISIQWKWGAAVFTSFPATGNCSLAMIKAGHQNTCIANTGGDHAGSPETSCQAIGGARGGGAANITGSWSGTVSVCN
jgi:hypothetical protein